MVPALSSARFATTVARLSQLPPADLAEVAFVGRSNAGKSSAINVLCRQRRLAFASKTPGRTQALNYFALGPPNAAPLAWLVDTPGYGFASAPLEVKRGWDQLAGRYLSLRSSLAGVVLVLDVRRGVTELDRALLGWMRADVPILVLLSKSDKLGHAQRAQAMRDVETALLETGLANPLTLLSFSATRRIGLDEAREIIGDWLAHEGAHEPSGVGVDPAQADAAPDAPDGDTQ